MNIHTQKTQQQRTKHQFGISLSYSGLSRAIDSKQIVHDLGGGNSNIFYFHPYLGT